MANDYFPSIKDNVVKFGQNIEHKVESFLQRELMEIEMKDALKSGVASGVGAAASSDAGKLVTGDSPLKVGHGSSIGDKTMPIEKPNLVSLLGPSSDAQREKFMDAIKKAHMNSPFPDWLPACHLPEEPSPLFPTRTHILPDCPVQPQPSCPPWARGLFENSSQNAPNYDASRISQHTEVSGDKSLKDLQSRFANGMINIPEGLRNFHTSDVTPSDLKTLK